MKYKVISSILLLTLTHSACQDQPTQPELGPSPIEPSYELSPLYGSDSKIAFAYWDWETDLMDIFVVNEDGSGLTALTGDCFACDSPNWSPDGTKIAYDNVPRTRTTGTSSS